MSSRGDSGELHAEARADRVMSGPVPVQRVAAARSRSGQEGSHSSAHDGSAGCTVGDGCGGKDTTVQRLHVIKAGSANVPQKQPDSKDLECP